MQFEGKLLIKTKNNSLFLKYHNSILTGVGVLLVIAVGKYEIKKSISVKYN